jgi:hypothetical protein
MNLYHNKKGELSMDDLIKNFKQKNGNKLYDPIQLMQAVHEKIDNNYKDIINKLGNIYKRLEGYVKADDCNLKSEGLKKMILGIYGLIILLLGGLTGFVVFKFNEIYKILLELNK